MLELTRNMQDAMPTDAQVMERNFWDRDITYLLRSLHACTTQIIILSYHKIYHVIIMSYYHTMAPSHNPSWCHHIIILSYQHQEFSSPWHHIPAVYTCTHTHLLFDVLSMTPPPHCVSNELVITPEFIQTVYETGPGVFLGEIAMLKKISPTQDIKISKYMSFIKSKSKSIDQLKL